MFYGSDDPFEKHCCKSDPLDFPSACAWPNLAKPLTKLTTVTYAALPEMAVSPVSSIRGARQLFNQRGPCLTSKGAVGKCTTFKECYPYFKIPDLGALDGWVLGIYDTCSYSQQDGRLAFGICCADLPSPPPTSEPQTPGGPLVEAPDQQLLVRL